jgi:diguanylate cyclase (GGDEF)-like protein
MKVANTIFAFKKIRIRLITYVGLILVGGFLATNILSYQISKGTIRATVLENELPLSSNTIYSEIQTDLLRPIFISSLMANDTFLRDWVIGGEEKPERIIRYLKNIRDKYDAFTSYFISAKSLNYYHFTGISRTLLADDPDDKWFFHAEDIDEEYEINIDTNDEQGEAITIFINYRVFDYDGNFIGIAGIGLGLDSVARMIRRYQNDFRRTIYFIDQNGEIHLQSDTSSRAGNNIHKLPGLDAIATKIVSNSRGAFVYQRDNETILLTTRYLPELKWYLLVELSESQATKELWNSFLVNLAIGLTVIVLTIFLIFYTVNIFQSRLEEMASTDKLTGLGNRQTFEIVMKQALAQFARSPLPFSLILFDIDNFKKINDSYGHLSGDNVLIKMSSHIRGLTRQSDILCRWGGEEFIILAPNCALPDATQLAENIRTSIMENRFVAENSERLITISAGVAEVRESESGTELLARADRALFAAKDKGRNRVEKEKKL